MELDREHLEEIIGRKPALAQHLGRIIDDRQSKAARATRRDRVGGEASVKSGSHFSGS